MNTRWGRRLGRAAGTVAFVLMACRAGVVFAEVNGYLTTGASYDDNLFRAPDGQVSPALSKADEIFTVGGGGVLGLANEHFQLNATGDVGENFYSKNSFLNSLAYDFTVQLTERQKFVDLDLEGSQTQSLSSFSDIRTPIRNLQSLTRTAARVGLAATSDVRIVFDAKFNRDTNSNVEIAQADYNQVVGGAGVGYFSPTGNSLVLEELRTYTNGLNLQSLILNNVSIGSKTNYVDDTTLLQLDYSPSPVLEVFAQGGYLRRSDQSVFHDNQNTPVGQLRLTYRPDSIVQVGISAGRQLSSQSYLIIAAIQDNYIKVSPALTFANGLKASFDFNYDQRNFGLIPQLGFASSSTNDQTAHYDASLSYLLLEHYQIAVTGYHEERHSNSASDTYTDNGLMLTFTIRSARPSTPTNNLEPADILLLP